jgi:hypothetical protein
LDVNSILVHFLDLLDKIVERSGPILLNLTFAYPERFALATVAAHAQSEQRLSSFGSLELHNCVYRVIFSAHFDTQDVLHIGAARIFQALRSLIDHWVRHLEELVTRSSHKIAFFRLRADLLLNRIAYALKRHMVYLVLVYFFECLNLEIWPVHILIHMTREKGGL